MQYVTLNNGVNMPQLGYGVYKVSDDQAVECVQEALEAGYRSIDTAAFYDNEIGVGKAIKASGLDRKDIFVTTKVWNDMQGYDKTLQAFEDSLDKLGLDYIDLYLIHWPCPDFHLYIETYQALEHLYKEGKVRAIGVCNFHIEHLQAIIDQCDVVPAVNQVECHPYFQQKELKDFAYENGIYIECWGPLHQGGDLLQDEVIAGIADAYGKTPAQIILRWHLQENSIVIPKSVTPSRIKENIDIFDFELSQDDMDRIATIDRKERIGREPNDMHIR
ncbi:MAG TPA: aldo/keto reductase [Pseudogracilibacillus sp.]|nr:aldo/keto reductase [Pseudogracilibacillus sp.]